MKNTVFAAIVCLLALVSCGKKVPASVPAVIRNGMIELKTPPRAPGQVSALGLKCDPIDTVRIAFVGVGGRGSAAVRRYTFLDGVKIVAFCDLKQENLDACQDILKEAGLPEADNYLGDEAYKELCDRDDIDLVYVCTDWLPHVPISLYALEHGHHVACEVPMAMTIDDCWKLVDACERTRLHCMMLENCCYDFFEMSALNMAQQGLFGEVYHVEGAYIHFLADHWDHSEPWRVDYNIDHRGDNYPTHGLGPIAQVLNIHRGDKMDYLVAMDTP